MKKICALLLLTVLLTSCQGVWTQDDKDAFYEACIDDTKSWINDPAKAKLYCECVTIRVMERYPTVSDALENIETISKDPQIQVCRIPILK